MGFLDQTATGRTRLHINDGMLLKATSASLEIRLPGKSLL